MTLGVRGVVVDAEGRVLLIEHTYVPGWHLPGGGVERGETAAAALARELEEEAGVQPMAPPRLISVHSQHLSYPGDHVLVYLVEVWAPCPATSRGEIHQVGWFEPDRLPPGVTRATRARLAEIFDGRARDPEW
jgi:ADP-ribose pyrophosphatase YjhB (NUDIX family)